MSFRYPEDLRYLDSHEYLHVEDDTVTIGITEYAIDQLGSIVFLELPEVGTEVIKGDEFGTIESVKAVETLYSPVSGKVIERNEALIDSPELLADDPYGEGWLLKVRLENPSEIHDTLTAEQYSALVEGN